MSRLFDENNPDYIDGGDIAKISVNGLGRLISSYL